MLKSMQHGLGVSSAFLSSVARKQSSDTGQQTAAIKAPGEQANSDALVLKNTAQQLAASPDQATYQQNLENLPMKVARNFPQTFDQQKVLQVGMTPAEVVTSQATEAQRQETNSFHRQSLGIESAKLNLQQQQMGVGTNGAPSDLARAIASGHIPLDRMGYLLARNPALISSVMQVDPTFDGSKAQAYPAVYKDFMNTKSGTAGGTILTGATAMEHLQELRDLNTPQSHIPGTPDYNAYQNKAETLASELDRLYHGTSTDVSTATIRKTLVATLPWQRDAAIRTQAQSAGDRLDNYEQAWKNAAPSKAYEAPMPMMSAKAMAARASLDPSYKVPSMPQGNSTPAQGGNAPQRGMVTVQIPGHPPGQIPSANLTKFKQDHPNAQVSQ
jgi:hypothetical protein